MADVVVTVPKGLWAEWLAEGDLARDDGSCATWNGECEYGFHMRGTRPNIVPGERVYVVAHGHIRGWAPLCAIVDGERFGGAPGSWALLRRGGAAAVTLQATGKPGEPATVRGFQGFRYRWWLRNDEIPFPDWQTRGVQ